MKEWWPGTVPTRPRKRDLVDDSLNCYFLKKPHNSYSAIYFYSVNCLPLSQISVGFPALCAPCALGDCAWSAPGPREALGCLEPPSGHFRPQAPIPEAQHPPSSPTVRYRCCHFLVCHDPDKLGKRWVRISQEIAHPHLSAFSFHGQGPRSLCLELGSRNDTTKGKRRLPLRRRFFFCHYSRQIQ